MKLSRKYAFGLVAIIAACALGVGCQSATPPAEGVETTGTAEITMETVDGIITDEPAEDTAAEPETAATTKPVETEEDTEENGMTEETEWKPAEDGMYLLIDRSIRGSVIGNKVSDMNTWMHTSWSEPLLDGYMAEVYPFVENMQFMTATGGEYNRDLFLDPYDTTVLDDYNFEPLINSCRNVVAQGIKPMIKTGNIPRKYSTVSTTGLFGVNVYPPDDYNVYYNYIQALTQALVDEFGMEEVKSWRWGCFTEYENGDWFRGTCEDYCKIYDYTTAAIQSVLGFDIKIGAHSMTVTEGIWDEREFIDHCINGINYCTGEQGTRLTYIAVSYYDSSMSAMTAKTDRLATAVDIVRDQVNDSIEAALAAGITQAHLDELGVTFIYYGVDEGRIHSESPGRDAAELISRIVGHTKQAAYDAMLLKLMVDENIDYFSAWEYHTAKYYGLPTVSYHVANEFYKMVGTTRVESTLKRYAGGGFRLTHKFWDALTSTDEEGNLYVMAYAFGETKLRDSDKQLHVMTDLDCQRVRITVSYINDDANFFDEWMALCEENGIGQNDFSWSPDGTQLPERLVTDHARQVYSENLTEGKNLTECAKLTSQTFEVDVIDGKLDFTTTLDLNTVTFLKIEPMK